MDKPSASAPVRPCPRLGVRAPDIAKGSAVASLLADRTRAGILRLLRDGPFGVCEFSATFAERENNVSNHLAKLRDAGLVRATRHEGDARWVFYERDEAAIDAARAALLDILGWPESVGVDGERRASSGRHRPTPAREGGDRE